VITGLAPRMVTEPEIPSLLAPSHAPICARTSLSLRKSPHNESFGVPGGRSKWSSRGGCPSFDTNVIVRPVVFHPRARDAIRAFPRDIRDRVGKALYLLQTGEQPGMPLSRPMPPVAPGRV